MCAGPIDWPFISKPFLLMAIESLSTDQLPCNSLGISFNRVPPIGCGSKKETELQEVIITLRKVKK